MVSFDPREKPGTGGAGRRPNISQRYDRPAAADGWHFLTGEPPSIERLTKAAGFRYTWDEETQQFAHPAGIVVLTPDGRLARYLFGLEYGPRDLRLALVEASEGRIGTAVDAALLYCYHYDPMTGRYGLVVMRVLRVAGAATVLALGDVHLRHGAPRTHATSAPGHAAPSTRHPAPSTRHPAPDSSMWPGTPLFPDSASTMAPRVDALYFFLVGLTAFFSLLIAGLIVYYAVKFRRRAPDSVGARIEGGLVLEITWTVIPLAIVLVIFFWGASVFFAMARPPADTLNIYVVGKQWMWKFQHLNGAARDQRAARAGRPAGEADHDVRGRHPRSLLPGVPREGGRHPGPVHRDLVRGRRSPAAITCSAPSTAARSHSGMIGQVVVHGAERVPDLAEQRRRQKDRSPRRAASCSRISPATPATAATRRGAARCSTACSARP